MNNTTTYHVRRQLWGTAVVVHICKLETNYLENCTKNPNFGVYLTFEQKYLIFVSKLLFDDFKIIWTH